MSAILSISGSRARFGDWWQLVVRMAQVVWATLVILPFQILDGWMTRRAMIYLAHRSEDISAELFMLMLWQQLQHRNHRKLLRREELMELFARRAKEIGREFDDLIAKADSESSHR